MRGNVRRVLRLIVDVRGVAGDAASAADDFDGDAAVVDDAVAREDVRDLAELVRLQVHADESLRPAVRRDEVEDHRHRIPRYLGDAGVRMERRRLLELEDLQVRIADTDTSVRRDAGDELTVGAVAGIGVGARRRDESRVVRRASKPAVG